MDDSAGADLDRIRLVAADLATTLGGAARASTTPGIERATLRLLGISGLDRGGRPLAASVVDRSVRDDPGRLSRGVLLPFAAAVQLYEASPLDIARDVASGTIDLDLEADGLADPARREGVQAVAGELLASAFARIEANRTARTDLLHVLGDAPEPLLCVHVQAGLVDRASPEAGARVTAGADLLLVDVPASRELVDRLADPVDTADDATGTARESRTEGEIAPAGSQRALADIRVAVDAAAAERRRYARIATVPRALGAPEAAVVAGFERLDAMRVDPLTEIVVDGVDPERALADGAFARRILQRAGCRVFVDPGPLVVAPDLAAGEPSSAVVRAGRAIALQALSVELARSDGVNDASIRVGTLPSWLLGERAAGPICLATIVVQRQLFPGIGLSIAEPSPAGGLRDRWWQLRTLGAVLAGGTASVTRDVDVAGVEAAAVENRGAADVVARIIEDIGPIRMGAGLQAVVAGIAASAAATLHAVETEGWDAIVGGPAGNDARMAAGTTARRGDAPDAAGSPSSTTA